MKNSDDRNHSIEALSQPGMAILPRGLYIQRKMSEQVQAKALIAAHIAENYVEDFHAVLLDAGSTAEVVAEAMFAKRKYLSVLTNNMGAYAAYTRAIASNSVRAEGQAQNEVISGLLNENELLLPGGRYDATYEALFGERTMTDIKLFTPNITIIGISGLRCGGGEGFFCHGAEEVQLKQLLLTMPTDTRLIATDWSKIGRRDAHSFGPVEQLGVRAKRAVVVTTNPPRNANSEDRKEFDGQVKRMKEAHIIVEQLDIGDATASVGE
jgi:DeoR/GlpR family transcriptional regulator of sugar metabolism